MGCGCGGSTGGRDCGGGARPEIEVPAEAPLFEELPGEVEPAIDEAAGEPSLIASSAQEWPRVRVNGLEIAAQAIAQELQYHPAQSRDEAVYLATQALVLRELLLQRIAELGLVARALAGVSEEEAAIRVLNDREVLLPLVDEATCRNYYSGNR